MNFNSVRLFFLPLCLPPLSFSPAIASVFLFRATLILIYPAGAPLPPGMATVLQARLPPPVVRDVMLTAHRYTAPEALKAGIVDMVVDTDGSKATVDRALEYANGVKGLAATGVRILLLRLFFLYSHGLCLVCEVLAFSTV
jgi:hypothetical protein